jgi:hypothetical protein
LSPDRVRGASRDRVRPTIRIGSIVRDQPNATRDANVGVTLPVNSCVPIAEARRASALGMFVLGAFLCALGLSSCAPSDEESEFLAKKTLLERQNRGIRELIEEEKRGSLVPTNRFLVGIHEKIVADLLNSQLPMQRPLKKRFVVRLESATVSLRDKFGVITLEGNVFRPKTPDRKTAVRVIGGLGAVEIDPKTGILRVKIAIDHIELLQAGFLEGVIGRGGKRWIAQKARPMIQDALPQLEIPVVLGRSIRIPAVQGEGVQLDSLRVPLNLSVGRVIAAAGKLWVTLDAEVGKVTGAEEGLGVAIKKKPKAAPK